MGARDVTFTDLHPPYSTIVADPLGIPADRRESNHFAAARTGHSVKPDAFYDLVERVSPAPRVELFARQPRLGWDSWGRGYE